jgi:hypothetical protein
MYKQSETILGTDIARELRSRNYGGLIIVRSADAIGRSSDVDFVLGVCVNTTYTTTIILLLALYAFVFSVSFSIDSFKLID